MELNVLERLPRPGQGQLLFRRALDVVERCTRGAPLGDRTQIRDRLRPLQPPAKPAEHRRFEPQQRRQITYPRNSSLNHPGHPPVCALAGEAQTSPLIPDSSTPADVI